MCAAVTTFQPARQTQGKFQSRHLITLATIQGRKQPYRGKYAPVLTPGRKRPRPLPPSRTAGTLLNQCVASVALVVALLTFAAVVRHICMHDSSRARSQGNKYEGYRSPSQQPPRALLLETGLSATSESKGRAPQDPCPGRAAFWIASQGRNTCVCPTGWGDDCVGCHQNCRVRGFKQRCLREFDPQQCPDCCTKTAQPPARQSFCADDASKQAAGALASGSGFDASFVFVVSSGHCGTSFLGHPRLWEHHYTKHNFTGVLIQHEASPDAKALKRVPWDDQFCAAAALYVKNIKLPDMALRLAGLPNRPGGKKKVWFETGHHVSLGIVPALQAALGRRVKFVRLRRPRLDVAQSFVHTIGMKGPCDKGCLYCLCPTDAAARCPLAGGTWGELSAFQQFLWLVDEIEAQWKQFLGHTPAATTLELDWEDQIQLPQLAQLGKFVGINDVFTIPSTEVMGGQFRNAHDHLEAAINLTWARDQDTQYQEMAGAHSCNKYNCVC